MRDILIAAYLDYCNNYATVELYAEHNGLEVVEAQQLISLGESVNSHDHPDA